MMRRPNLRRMPSDKQLFTRLPTNYLVRVLADCGTVGGMDAAI